MSHRPNKIVPYCLQFILELKLSQVPKVRKVGYRGIPRVPINYACAVKKRSLKFGNVAPALIKIVLYEYLYFFILIIFLRDLSITKFTRSGIALDTDLSGDARHASFCFFQRPVESVQRKSRLDEK